VAAVTLTRGSATRAEAMAAFAAEGCSAPRFWSNGPGDAYAAHEHGQRKVLFCLAGSIVFETDDGDVAMHAGDRLDVPARARHAASVGANGCECVEAWAP
jgi:mannose-6-phosphate isomerase-like protein (cupin superfamily)